MWLRGLAGCVTDGAWRGRPELAGALIRPGRGWEH